MIVVIGLSKDTVPQFHLYTHNQTHTRYVYLQKPRNCLGNIHLITAVTSEGGVK